MGGVQRATKFVRYLTDFGWNPTIVTVKDILYYAKDTSLLDEVKKNTIVRTGSLDPARLVYLLSKVVFKKKENQSDQFQTNQSTFMNSVPFLTKYLFYPDSKKLWIPFAQNRLNQLQKKQEYQAIFSTAPPISAHLLAAKTNFPWIADFRDYWTIGDGIYTPTKWHQKKYEKIMGMITQRASKIIAVSEPISESIRQSANKNDRNKIIVIPNGFDPNDFEITIPQKFDRFTFVYSGNLNQKRSPDNFFRALDLVLNENPKLQDKINCCFIGKHFDLKISTIPEKIKNNVTFKDYVPHKRSLSYTLGANVLLLFLSSDSAEGVVTGKVFEYLGTQKPILAIIPKTVAAYNLLKNMPNCYFADPDNVSSIKDAVLRLIDDHFDRELMVWNLDKLPQNLCKLTRREQTRKLADLLNQVI